MTGAPARVAAVVVLAVAVGCSGGRSRAPRAPATTATPAAPASAVPCASRPDLAGPPPEFLVTARHTTFDRACIAASAGRLVLVLDNEDAGVGHSLTVLAPDGARVISSGVLVGPRVYSLNFQVAPGTYHYRCDVHPQRMHGVIEVR